MSDYMDEERRYREFLQVHDRLVWRHGPEYWATFDAAVTAGDDEGRVMGLLATYYRRLEADPEVVEFQAQFPDTDSVWRRHWQETASFRSCSAAFPAA